MVKFMLWLLYLIEGTLVPIESESLLAPEPVQMILEKIQCVAPARIQTPDYPAHSLLPYHLCYPNFCSSTV